MRLIYTLGIWCYEAILSLAALFIPKAKVLKRGRKITWPSPNPSPDQKVVWIHAASLGEFEQGRPVLDQLKKQGHYIILSFYSPSGYQQKKDYSKADLVVYLPSDTPKKARAFIQHFQPDIALFIKYEFWFNFLIELCKKKIPVVYFSSIFRPNHLFFKWYGKWFLNQLKTIHHFFVQNEISKNLLAKHHIHNVTLAGDTRFDTVFELASNPKPFPEIETWIKKPVLVVGSSWPEDHLILKQVFMNELDIQIIIAPHEINHKNTFGLAQELQNKAGIWSKKDFDNKQILIIDQIGLLKHLYQYASIAFIGGGFGKGIHNTLEAAAYGVPVVFGHKFQKFQEAKDLLKIGAAKYVTNQNLATQAISFYLNPTNNKKSGEEAKAYVLKNKGATVEILNKIESILTPIA